MKKIFIILISCMFLSNCSKLNIFGFGKSKTEFEKYSVNEPLWKSSLSFLSKYPNVETNLKEGFISTEWIISNKNPNTRFRITSMGGSMDHTAASSVNSRTIIKYIFGKFVLIF